MRQTMAAVPKVPPSIGRGYVWSGIRGRVVSFCIRGRVVARIGIRCGIYDRVMLSGVHLLPVAKVAEIGDIAQELAERIAGKGATAAEVSFAGPPALGPPAEAV